MSSLPRLPAAVLGALFMLLAPGGCSAVADDDASGTLLGEESETQVSGLGAKHALRRYVVVPNRSDSTLAVLSTTGEILGKVTRDTVGFEFEPTYATHRAQSDLVAVADRKNSRIMVFDSDTMRYRGYIPASDGLFHLWPSADGRTLFVVADVDDVVDVVTVRRTGRGIRYARRTFDAGAAVPGGKPHDVVADDRHFYVTVQVAGAAKDEILKVDQRSLAVEGRLAMSLDTHLGMPTDTPFLLVPEQTDGELNYVVRDTFEVAQTVKGLP